MTIPSGMSGRAYWVDEINMEHLASKIRRKIYFTHVVEYCISLKNILGKFSTPTIESMDPKEFYKYYSTAMKPTVKSLLSYVPIRHLFESDACRYIMKIIEWVSKLDDDNPILLKEGKNIKAFYMGNYNISEEVKNPKILAFIATYFRHMKNQEFRSLIWKKLNI
jgi:hypothetical protein